MSDINKILVGKIVAPQGIRGEVRVQTYSARPDDFKSFSVLTDKFAPADFKYVRLLNPTSTVIIAKIRGIDDRNAAETLRGTELYIARDALPDLDGDEYYQSDLIGFDVLRDNTKIGVITGFQNFGAGDIIELDNGQLVSFIGANVDIAAKVVKVK